MLPIQQKLSNRIALPIVILFFLVLLDLEYYWYLIAIALLTLLILGTHKRIEFDEDNIYFNKNLNPFSKRRFIAIKAIERAKFVDRTDAYRGTSYPHSYLRLFTANNKHVTYRIALSKHSMQELMQTLKQLNIETQLTTEDPDKDKPL